MISNNFTPKKPQKYVCETCDYKSCNKKDYNRHVLTKKHKNSICQCLSIEKTPKNPTLCACGKIYKDTSGLWRHKKTCKQMDNKDICKIKDTYIGEDNLKITSTMFYDLLKQNNELQKNIIEMSMERGQININNCNNKTFNLQVYLNETCKDAINLTEFVDSIQIKIKDLENVGEKGYAEGITDIFINNLQQLKSHSRPIHCTDSKRETLYIKDENQWTKDDENKTTLTKAIKQVANKNIKQISEWQKTHPEFLDPDSKQNDKYIKIVFNAMSGSTQEEQKHNINKIIKNVTKEVVIDK